MDPSDVVVSEGEVFVCDFNNGIQVFGVDGSFIRQWSTRGSDQGEFAWAWVAVSKDRCWSAITTTIEWKYFYVTAHS